MEINWLGYSCFRIKGSKATVITDPYSPNSGYSMGKQTANIVTVSHRHPEHSFLSAIGGEPRVINGPGEYEISGVMVIGLSTFHDSEKGKTRGKNTVYLMEIDELSVCHLGDLGHALTAEEAEDLGNIDILMIPVGGVSTITASVASETVRQLEPKVVIPMHYKTLLLKRELDPVDKFLNEMGVKEVTPQPKLSITKANLPLTTQVVVLNF
jgi:L-ascorbate metabolism protein UlaG (beta-lactamase superfamily)